LCRPERKTQRQVAEEIGKARAHVRRMAEVWDLYGDRANHGSHSFDWYYQEVKRPKAKQSAESDPDETTPEPRQV
jgi:hypothetical protein